jgi:hypothetical protein
MTIDAKAIAEGYIAVWNETDAVRRSELLARGWTEGARYSDPLAEVAGIAAISQHIGGVQARFPNFRFSLIGKPDGFGDRVRFSWALGPDGGYVDAPIEGTDFAVLEGEKLATVTGFLDRVPAA